MSKANEPAFPTYYQVVPITEKPEKEGYYACLNAVVGREFLQGHWIGQDWGFTHWLRPLEHLPLSREQADPSVLLEAAIDRVIHQEEDRGREGCTYGDTVYDSPSAVYGYNTCLRNIKLDLQATLTQYRDLKRQPMVTILNDKSIAVEIPPEGNINNSYLWGGSGQYWVRYTTMPKPGKFKTNEIKLPEGYWGIAGRPNNLTEEQWEKIVDWYEDSNDSSYDPQYNVTTYFKVFTDYVTGDDFDTAIESGLSLLASKNIDPGKVIILIKQ
jgi:hypothetical protein